MTGIAGLVGVCPTGSPEQACRTSLEGLAVYGSRSSVRSVENAAFGINLRELVPEDRFDHQPYANKRFLLVADIRLDNRPELISALGRPEASGLCDADLFFRAWCRWQHQCLDRIAGDYAFAVYDRQSNRLTLGRDPIGQRPLFYARVGSTFFFASMPSGILPHGRFTHDHVRIAQRLAGQENRSRRSYFDGITRLLSGETLVISGNEIRSNRWEPRVDTLSGRPPDALIPELRDIFDQAVGSRLRRVSGPIATHLSSGYDSTAVTVTAAMLDGSRNIVAYTSAPLPGLVTAPVRNRIVDESNVASRSAHHFGIRHEVVSTPEPLLDSLRNHTRYFQEPVRNVLNMGWYAEIERRAVARNAQVLLTGDLGNLTLSAGGLPELSEWLRRGALLTWFKEALAALDRPDVRLRGVLWASFTRFFPERFKEEVMRRFVGQPRWSTACFVRPEIFPQLPPPGDVSSPRPVFDRLEILRGFDAGAFRKGSLAKHGIDERDPTADRRLIEFALRLPPEQLLHRGVYKPLARAALADRVPDFVLNLPVRGYQGADWISRVDKPSAMATYEEISANQTVQDVIDLPRLKRAIGDWPDLADAAPGQVESFGRHVTNALAMGVFIFESGDHALMGRPARPDHLIRPHAGAGTNV